RQQPPGQILQVDARGTPPAGPRDSRLGTNNCDSGAVSGWGRRGLVRRLRAFFVRLGGLFSHERRDCELADEIASHLALHIEENLSRGMTREEARRRALIKLGGIEMTKEIYREQRGLPVLETLLQDVRFGMRMLWKNRGFTLVAVA